MTEQKCLVKGETIRRMNQEKAVKILHQVPYSTGRRLPEYKLPAGACDCHHHIYDPVHFPYAPEDKRNQPPATVDAYRLLQKRLGTERDVIIQASAYGTDNSCLLDALSTMGRKNTRGIAVCRSDVSEKELEKMAELGVCGLRVNLASPLKINRYEEIIPLSEKIAQFGWHMQFWLKPDDIAELQDMFHRVCCPVVFDHRGHIPQPEGTKHPAFGVISNLLRKGNTWVKLSGLDHDTKVGYPSYIDTVTVGAAFVKAAPERMVWGTDWPHPSSFSAGNPFPDDAWNLDLLRTQAQDENVWHRILVKNPNELYHFAD
jgi:D-galactarolactone isomerase